MMTTVTATVNKDNDKDTNSEDSNDLIFDTTTNLWSDAFLAGRGVILTMMKTATTTMTTAATTTKVKAESEVKVEVEEEEEEEEEEAE